MSIQSPSERLRKQNTDKQLPSRQTTPPAFRRDTLDPVSSGGKRKGFSPSIIVLLLLAGGIALFATGNLPQMDGVGKRSTHWLQANNDSIVTTILNSGPAVLMAGGVLLLAVLIFLIRNASNRRANGE